VKPKNTPEDHWHRIEPGRTDMDILGFGMHSGQLRVMFSAGSKVVTYQYSTSEKSICCRWDQATSVGKFFHQYIKPLPYAKIT
jgi:hypothetical protein